MKHDRGPRSNGCGRWLRALVPALLFAAPLQAHAESPAAVTVTITADAPGPIINRDIFGQFAEHLGEGIYGGVWVGRDSKIPNVRGIRSDVVQALRALKVPNVRWPGGCFADEYHWRGGIGPEKHRTATVNANWGNVVEPNTFGTEEYMDFVQQIGSEAYVNINVGTGSPQEAAEWLEYMTTNVPSKLGKERAANGHAAPYRIKYLGIGNESWGCGGNMSADQYVQQLRLFTTFVHNMHPDQARPIRWVPGPNEMQRIAVGPEDDKPEYTEAVMKAWQDSKPWRWGFEHLSLHHYTMGKTPMSSPATGFGEKEYADFVKETLAMDALIAKHTAIMDKYDPQKKVGLTIDEWGVWLQPIPGTNPRFLKQQNSLRDAILASLNLNIFARRADRVRMANIAQMVNVLQGMILTDGNRMLLTPTYYVYRMYVPFQDAQLIPVSLNRRGEYRFGDVIVPNVDAIAARGKDGDLWLAVTNIDPNKPSEVSASMTGANVSSAVGEILSGNTLDAINTFERPDIIRPKPVSARANGGRITLTIPPKSVAVVRLVP